MSWNTARLGTKVKTLRTSIFFRQNSKKKLNNFVTNLWNHAYKMHNLKILLLRGGCKVEHRHKNLRQQAASHMHTLSHYFPRETETIGHYRPCYDRARSHFFYLLSFRFRSHFISKSIGKYTLLSIIRGWILNY